MNQVTGGVTLSDEEVRAIKCMSRDDLLRHAQSKDMGVFVEAALRLDDTTKLLNKILIALTAALVYFAWKAR